MAIRRPSELQGRVGIAEFQHEMACKIETAEAGVLGPQGTEKHAAVLRELISR